MLVPPRMPNGMSTTSEPEWSAAIGPSTAGSEVGMVPIGFGLPDQPASKNASTATTAMAGAAW